MKITRVRPLIMGTPWRNLTFVIVETDEGLSGVGEVRMTNNTDALLGYLSEAAPRYVIGKDPFESKPGESEGTAAGPRASGPLPCN